MQRGLDRLDPKFPLRVFCRFGPPQRQGCEDVEAVAYQATTSPAVDQRQALNAPAHVVAENMAWFGRGVDKMSKACWKTPAENLLKWKQGIETKLATK